MTKINLVQTPHCLKSQTFFSRLLTTLPLNFLKCENLLIEFNCKLIMTKSLKQTNEAPKREL